MLTMSGYTKLFNSILASTVWSEPMETRIVWITLLAMADRNGVAEGSIPGLAVFARLPVEATKIALERLMAPDPDSRSKEQDGRRIEAIEGGWRLVNHAKYRAKMGADERREYVKIKAREYRRKRVDTASTNDDKNRQSRHIAEAEATPKAQERTHAPGASALAGTLPRDHVRHSWCSSRGKCVPDFLHAEFCASVGGDGADQRLKAFYEAVELGWPDGPIGDDPVKLWRREFAAKFPSVAPTKQTQANQIGRRRLVPADEPL